jgi:hypothetical protein
MSADATPLERVLGEVLRAFRRDQIDPLRLRVAALEQRGGGETIAQKVMRGAPVDNQEWLRFVGRLYRDFGSDR